MSVHSGFDRRLFLRRTGLAMLAGVAGPGLLAACGDDDAGEAGGGGLKEVTFLNLVPIETMSMSVEMYADASGIFEKNGLKVTFQVTKGAAQAIQTIVSGRALVTRVGVVDVVTAAGDKGQKVLNIGTYNENYSQRIISAKTDPVTEPSDLVGKTMGVSSIGGTSDKTMSLMLVNEGFEPGQVKRQQVGLTPGTFELVRRGEIAAYNVSLDTSIIVSQQNADAVSADFSEFVKSGGQVYATTADLMSKERDALASFVTSIGESMTAIIADTALDDTLRTLRTKYTFDALDDDTVAKESLKLLRDGWKAHDATPLMTDTAHWSAAYDELVKAGMAKAGGTPAEWMTNDLLA